MTKKSFSNDLEQWLKVKEPRTLGSLGQEFSEKSFAVVIMVLMFIPALPLPTGGISHVFEVITLLLAGEMVIGRKSIWLPNRFINKRLGPATEGKAVPFIARRIRWLEKYSRPRLTQLTGSKYYLPFVGVLIFIFTLASLVAPPFSGLDTLPAMGVIAICLSVILEDFNLVLVGIVIGLVGIGVEITIGAAIDKSLRHFF